MERKQHNGKEFLVGYHTQESRANGRLSSPLCCRYENAWLGVGYYFWLELEFAKYWGEDFKRKATGKYEVYSALIEADTCLNAVFNEEHYYFFRSCLDKAVKHFQKLNVKISMQRIHEFLAENFWKSMGITGIMYDDIPMNPHGKTREYSLIEYSEGNKVKFLYYKKRIQIVLFKLDAIHNFDLVSEDQSS